MNGAPGAGAPCLRCGDCLAACPAGLAPALLLMHLRAGREDLAAPTLAACDGCGACDRACPTAIPLHAVFAAARADAETRRLARHRADAARERHQARARRLQRWAEEAEARDRRRQATVASADAVAEALARARARREGRSP